MTSFSNPSTTSQVWNWPAISPISWQPCPNQAATAALASSAWTKRCTRPTIISHIWNLNAMDFFVLAEWRTQNEYARQQMHNINVYTSSATNFTSIDVHVCSSYCVLGISPSISTRLSPPNRSRFFSSHPSQPPNKQLPSTAQNQGVARAGSAELQLSLRQPSH